MDVSNVTIKGSTAASVAPAVGTARPAGQGNSLPDVRQVEVRSETSQAVTPQENTSVNQPNIAELRELVGQANEALQARFSDLKFTVDDSTNINIVRIEDSETGELIRQFPSEAMLAIARALDNMQQGSVFEEKA